MTHSFTFLFLDLIIAYTNESIIFSPTFYFLNNLINNHALNFQFIKFIIILLIKY